LFKLFASGTGGKFTATVFDTGGNLPLVSPTPAVPVAKYAAGAVFLYTGGSPLCANILVNF
jgi:hypothetical protein